MREDCKFFQIRTYASGDAARFCALGLAPEAPWRCPADCRRFERRAAEAGKRGAGAGSPGAPDHDREPQLDTAAAGLLGAAEQIISAAGPEIVAEQERRRRHLERQPWWHKLRRQAPWRR